ncbi:MAG: hypothetical protein ACJAWL_003299 [Motiliproteus sp.]|jgi:uncharacterized protein (DUF2132 family)
MNDDIDYKNNPLHGINLKKLLQAMVDHYGFEILFAYLNINCFKTNPSIDSSVKFLKKTDWAREKVEAFYLYQFKNLPRASAKQFQLPPRERIIPREALVSEPAELSLADAERLREKRARMAAERGPSSGPRSFNERRNGAAADKRKSASARAEDRQAARASAPSTQADADPWAKWRK